jgi:cytochrome c oxidase assembly protein subunit 15
MTPIGLRLFTKFVAASTLFLIFAGAMVTSTGSGLAVPDWPLSYGMLMPKMVGGIFYEHGHRMIAATVGFLTVLQAIWLQLREPKRRARILGWCAVGAVIAQGVLGGLTVLFLLPPAISIAHAGLAEIFFCLNVSIAVITHGSSRASRPSFVLPAIVYGQILLGALMRHLGAGLAIPDFPLSFGHVVPSFTSTAIAVNFAHRVGAVVVLVAIIVAARRRMTVPLLSIVVLQIALGAMTVLSAKHPIITSLHVMTGAATLAMSLIFALTEPAAERAGAFVASEATA